MIISVRYTSLSGLE